MPFPKLNEEETKAAMLDPQPGDCFCEMACFYCFVVDRSGDTVITCETQGPGTLPDDGKWRVQTVQEMYDRFAYGSIDGFWVVLYKRGDLRVLTWECPIDYEQEDGELAPFGWLP